MNKRHATRLKNISHYGSSTDTDLAMPTEYDVSLWGEIKSLAISPRRSGFSPMTVHVGFVVENVALLQVFLRQSSFYQCIILIFHHFIIIRDWAVGLFQAAVPREFTSSYCNIKERVWPNLFEQNNISLRRLWVIFAYYFNILNWILNSVYFID